MQGRLREDKKTYAFFLDIQKAYDSVWHDGLWYKLWDMGVKGRMWRVMKKMYEPSKSAVLLEREKSDTFTIEQGMAQGCSLSPIFNPRRACAERVTVVVSCMCVCVCVSVCMYVCPNTLFWQYAQLEV